MSVAFIGTGKMAESILGGLVSSGVDASQLIATARRDERRQQLEARHGVRVLAPVDAAREADMVVLGVKPHQVADMLDEVVPHLRKGALVVSLAAGVSTDAIEAHLPGGAPVVRVMPNTPALVGQAMSGISAGRHAGPEHVDRVSRMMAAVGRVVVLPESQLDALTAVSGSGVAYVYHVAEAMIEAGVQLGLSREVATQLVTQTVVGAGAMMSRPGTHPSLLREDVTSPGGTTAQALNVLDEYRVRAAFAAAMKACRDRSVELGRQ